MASVNKVILMGNCGRDPEVRYLPSGAAVATVTLATSSKRKDKATGEMVEATQWHRLRFFDRLAEVCGEYVKKGSKIYVEGTIKYGKYTDKDGIERNTTDILVREVQMIGSKDGAKPSAPSRPNNALKASSEGGSGLDDDSLDEIPF